MVKELKLHEKTTHEAANLARDYQVFDTDVRGLSVAIYPSGNRAFTLHRNDQKSKVRHAFGKAVTRSIEV